MRHSEPRRCSAIENLERRLLLASPVNQVPGPQTCIEDTSFLFSGATDTRISFTDPDGGGPYEVELNGVNGTVSIPPNPTVMITGNGTNAVTVRGTLGNCNAAIANILFKPSNGFEGLARLVVETDDSVFADTDFVNITVTPNASPVNILPGTQTTGIGAALRFSAERGNLFSFDDIDGPGPFEVEVFSNNGTISIVDFSGATVTNNGSNNVTIVGSLQAANAAISDFLFTPTAGFTGNALVLLETDDLNGLGGRSRTDPVTVRVVDGAPPAVSTGKFDFETNHALEFTFNHAITQTTLNNSDISVRSQPGNQIVPITVGSIVYNPDTATVRYNLANRLPDGNYDYRLLNNAVANASGFTNGEYRQPFYVLGGDANRDRSVDFNDLLIVAQNYGLNGRTFSQGNFDYSTDGLVSFGDLLILAQQYSVTLPGAIKSRSWEITRDVLSIA